MNSDTSYLARALALWNSLTNPARLRTDRQHAICKRGARRVKRVIARFPSCYVKENDNTGKLYLARP